MKSIYFACYFMLLIGIANSQGKNEFRSDYEYYTEADGWFKLHRMPLNWQEARLRCAYEGAMLTSPTTYSMTAVLLHIVDKNTVEAAYTGIHATVSNGVFHSLEGIPISEINVRWRPGNPDNQNNNENCIVYHKLGLEDVDCSRPFPYICFKKRTKDLVVTECGTTDREFYLEPRTNKCYKFHNIGRPYSVAAGICSAEGGHLAIINSETEADVLKKLFAKYNGTSLAVSYHDLVRLGFYNWNDSNFFGTIHGQSLQQAGYAKWSKGQPNYVDGGKPQRCGGMFRTGLLDDTYCADNLAFICEKSVGIIQNK